LKKKKENSRGNTKLDGKRKSNRLHRRKGDPPKNKNKNGGEKKEKIKEELQRGSGTEGHVRFQTLKR